ncbi:hypothetical protein B0J14DRAFT_557044 [Halenospora varia]|nr:hypothetical protein B0J14DRAFT_557044 [Halenospora varia]
MPSQPFLPSLFPLSSAVHRQCFGLVKAAPHPSRPPTSPDHVFHVPCETIVPAFKNITSLISWDLHTDISLRVLTCLSELHHSTRRQVQAHGEGGQHHQSSLISVRPFGAPSFFPEEPAASKLLAITSFLLAFSRRRSPGKRQLRKGTNHHIGEKSAKAVSFLEITSSTFSFAPSDPKSSVSSCPAQHASEEA